jgi:hypothetical protein
VSKIRKYIQRQLPQLAADIKMQSPQPAVCHFLATVRTMPGPLTRLPSSDAASHAEAIMTLNVEIDAALVLQLREMLERLALKPCAKHDWKTLFDRFPSRVS